MGGGGGGGGGTRGTCPPVKLKTNGAKTIDCRMSLSGLRVRETNRESTTRTHNAHAHNMRI